MELGCFSVSLSVKDLQKSKQFYQTLGFKVFHGMEDQGWLIMKNETAAIGLFQGMFEGNIMTFNPGWTPNAEALKEFTDVRDIQNALMGGGVKLTKEVEENTTGPGSFTTVDPDGNVILIDQHV